MRNFALTKNKAAIFFAMTLLPSGFMYSQAKKDTANEKKIQEVVLVGYGTMQKKQVTSSITSLSASDLPKGVGGASIATALQGKVAGLVMSGTASPNSGNTFRSANST